jgi:hypothetical protein
MALFRHKITGTVIDVEQFWNDAPYPKGVCTCGADVLQHFGTPHIHIASDIAVDINEGDYVLGGDSGNLPLKRELIDIDYEKVT